MEETRGLGEGEGGDEMIVSQGLGTRGLSESDSPNMKKIVGL
jgi:hypothetical protein